MNEDFIILKLKLEKFINKYQTYKLIKGLFFALSIYIAFILIESLIEYFSYLSITSRNILFFTTIFSFLIIFIYYIFLPLLTLLKFRKSINFKQANNLIVKYFPQLDDKLLNAIELNLLLDKENNNYDLLLASIEQRTAELKPLRFNTAINFTLIKRNFLYLIISLALLLIIYSFAPKVFLQGTARIINYNVYFEKEAPFDFELQNNSFNIRRGTDYSLHLKIVGEYVPNEVFIVVGDNFFRMENAENGLKNTFNFTIRNINNSMNFKFFADKFYSKSFNINVLPSPSIQSFTLTAIPPSYTGYEKSVIANSGDITVPAGTKLVWKFTSKNTDKILFSTINDTSIINISEKSNITKTFINSTKYLISAENEYFESKEKLEYYVNIIQDEFPLIEIKEIEDSLKVGAFYYFSNISDDYGFSKLDFVYDIKDKNDSTISHNVKSLDINKNSKNQNTFFYFDFTDIKTNMNEKYIEYYFQVFDNDYINGFKSAKSYNKVFKPLSVSDIQQEILNLDKSTKDFIKKSQNITEDIRKDIFNFKKKELNNELTDWDKQNFATNLVEKQKKLDDLLKQLSNENAKRNNFNKQFYKEQHELLEKQKRIQQLLDQVIDDELKALLDELKKLSEEFENKDFENIKQNFDFSYKELNDKLERSLELLKRYQVEENVLHMAEDLKKLSEIQDELSKEKINKSNKEEITNQQKELSDEFEKIKEKFNENIENNKNLEKPYKLEKLDESINGIDQKLKYLNEKFDENSNKKNSQQQQEISKDLKKLSEQMQNMFGNMNKQTMQIGIEDLRQIIENLSTFSINQEDTYNLLNQTLINNPNYLELISQQNKLKNDFVIIEDSLKSLSKQIPQLSNLILKELKEININLLKTNEEIERRSRRGAMRTQRFILNSANILALYLDELKEQMQKQMSSSGSGNGKNKSKSQDLGAMKSQQENFKEQLKQMLEDMKKGNGKMDSKSINKRIVKMLQDQEIFNKMLGEMQNKEGINPELSQKLKQIKQLTDKNIEDLINKNINNNLLERNNLILTRLLEAEKAEKEREKDKKRESEEAKDKKIVIPEMLKIQFEKDTKSKELLEKSNLDLKNYYKNLTKEYFIKLK
ncbi:MAG: hypothetical protein JXA16_13430 [Bacteroidales bacterium]|nr:hypothetical protein [Bacteroidales bacterium]